MIADIRARLARTPDEDSFKENQLSHLDQLTVWKFTLRLCVISFLCWIALKGRSLTFLFSFSILKLFCLKSLTKALLSRPE